MDKLLLLLSGETFLQSQYFRPHDKWASIFRCFAEPETNQYVQLTVSEKRLDFEVVGQCASSAGQSTAFLQALRLLSISEMS